MRIGEILRVTVVTVIVGSAVAVTATAPLTYRCALTVCLTLLALNGAATIPGAIGGIGKTLLKGAMEGVQMGARETVGFTCKWLLVIIAAYSAWRFFGDDITEWLLALMRQAAQDTATGVMDNFKGLFG